MFNSKLLGGILLIVGTSIGGGMLALPVATAEVGFLTSVVLMTLCWLIMTTGAFLILEVNLRLPAGSNMVSMAKSTFGLPGQIVAWIAYLVLLYSLLSAYISGGSDVFNGLLQQMHIHVPNWVTALLFTALFSLIVYSGIRTVDIVNRGLMFGKLGVYLLLVFLIFPYIHLPVFHVGSWAAATSCLMILATSFGFASIVPSLRDYFNDDVQSLRRVIWLGSLIPLICYIIWNLVIMGALQHDNLVSLVHSEHATSGLNIALNSAIHNAWISSFFGFFTSICMITAFLGVSLGLFDFLADGLKLKKQGIQGQTTLLLTFLPPLILVLLSPGIYLSALGYAGVCCVILLLMLPAMMAWKGRRTAGAEDRVLLPGGNVVLFSVVAISVVLLYLA